MSNTFVWQLEKKVSRSSYEGIVLDGSKGIINYEWQKLMEKLKQVNQNALNDMTTFNLECELGLYIVPNVNVT